MLVFKAKCPACAKTVLHAAETDGSKKVELFDPTETRMLVIVATPEVDGKKRIALGPCQRKEPLYREGEEPVIYFAHVKHRCQLPPTSNTADLSATIGTLTNSGQVMPGPLTVNPTPIEAPPIQVPLVQK